MLYEIKARYTKRMEETDAIATVKEINIVEDLTFGDAEQTIKEKLKKVAFTENVDVLTMKRLNVFDLVETDNAENIYKCKADFTIIDDSGKERVARNVIYVGAKDIESARRTAEDFLNGYDDAKLVAVEETKVIAIYRK